MHHYCERVDRLHPLYFLWGTQIMTVLETKLSGGHSGISADGDDLWHSMLLMCISLLPSRHGGSVILRQPTFGPVHRELAVLLSVTTIALFPGQDTAPR